MKMASVNACLWGAQCVLKSGVLHLQTQEAAQSKARQQLNMVGAVKPTAFITCMQGQGRQHGRHYLT